jgi:hypothetical protein
MADVEDMMRRLTKGELLRFDSKPLFLERKAYTAKKRTFSLRGTALLRSD